MCDGIDCGSRGRALQGETTDRVAERGESHTCGVMTGMTSAEHRRTFWTVKQGGSGVIFFLDSVIG